VAPHGADIEQDRLPFVARFFEGLWPPFVPVDRLMRGRPEIRAHGIFQPILSGLRHECPWAKIRARQKAAPEQNFSPLEAAGGLARSSEPGHRPAAGFGLKRQALHSRPPEAIFDRRY
jgi:hypothetical protein